MEEFACVGVDLFAFFKAQQAQVVALQYEFVDACHLVGNRLGCRYFVLFPLAGNVEAGAFDKVYVVWRNAETNYESNLYKANIGYPFDQETWLELVQKMIEQ